MRKQYFAEINVQVAVDQNKLVWNSDAKDKDYDSEFSCDLSVINGANFLYKIKRRHLKTVLTLKDDNSTLIFIKTKGSREDGLIGTWSLTENSQAIQTITELTFKNLEEVNVLKTCNLY